MTAQELRNKYLNFFASKGHTIIPSASLVPENDASSLFNTAGMQPLVPYLLGQKHPGGTRLVDVQKCLRTGDIEDVGDNRHLTFFEMLGNWSLGDYFKADSIRWSYEFLTNTEFGLGLDPKRLYVTVFKGEQGIPRDEESIAVWQTVLGENGLTNEVAVNETMLPEVRIVPLGAEDNFWIAGATGPCGADTEIFYDTRPEEGPLTGSFSALVKSFRLIEIWNNVFMEFNKTPEGQYEPLAKKNVDTGMGLERTITVVNGKSNVFETEIFASALALINTHTTLASDVQAARVIADHIRSATFLLADGVVPSNTDRGYVLRRLIRRAVRSAKKLGAEPGALFTVLVADVVLRHKDAYPEVLHEQGKVVEELQKEVAKFLQALGQGEKEFAKLVSGLNGRQMVTGAEAFKLFESYGLPIDIVTDLAREAGLTVDTAAFQVAMINHQSISRAGAEQKFKGGLASTGVMETKYHTATHLLNAGLRAVLGPHVAQKGSNITAERLRFDFVHPEKLTEEQKKKVEDFVNGAIALNLPVSYQEVTVEEAKALKAVGVFGDRYGEKVTVYTVGNEPDYFSREICGGPHVEQTGTMGKFKILKEEAVSAGVRRIKAVLE